MKSLPDFIKICEVGPRDGLQNEKVFLTIEQKLELIETAAEACLLYTSDAADE